MEKNKLQNVILYLTIENKKNTYQISLKSSCFQTIIKRVLSSSYLGVTLMMYLVLWFDLAMFMKF